MKESISYILTFLLGLILGVLFTFQYQSINKTVEKQSDQIITLRIELPNEE